MVYKALANRYSRAPYTVTRYSLFHMLPAQILVRNKVPVELRLRKKRNAGIVGHYSVARNTASEPTLDGGHSLHSKQVSAYNSVVAAAHDIGIQPFCIHGICKIYRRGNTGRAVQISRAIDSAESRRSLTQHSGIGG